MNSEGEKQKLAKTLSPRNSLTGFPSLLRKKSVCGNYFELDWPTKPHIYKYLKSKCFHAMTASKLNYISQL